VVAEKLLLAIGRVANTQGFGLENWEGVRLAKTGFVEVGEDFTAASGLYAIGDLTGGFGFSLDEEGFGPRYMLAHTSSAQGIYVVEKLAGKKPDPINYLAIPRCTYSYPQIASLGLTEREACNRAKLAGKDEDQAVKVGKFPFKVNGRAMMLGESEGFVKIVADSASGDLLGVHITGPNATELIAEPSIAKLFDGSAWELAQAIRPHPALVEVIMEAARAVEDRAIHL
jgi:dihydrolipoamide dehydrogenase